MIEDYKFGYIIIDGVVCKYDVEVRWTGEVLKWDTERRHLVGFEDVGRAVQAKPEVIVIGTGQESLVEVEPELIETLASRGIKVFIDKTEDAIKTFNVINEESIEEEGRQKKIIGLFHIAC